VQAQPLDLLPITAVYLLSVVLLLLAIECGFQLNRKLRARIKDESDAHVGVVAGASLGLLGFLLAFVVNLGTNVFSERLHLIIAEVNAISTAHLRAGLLEEPQRSASRQLLTDYVDLRLQAWQFGGLDEALRRSLEIQTQLWTLAEHSAIEQPTPTKSLYLGALNDVFDRHTERVVFGLGIRIPPTVVLSLYLVAILSVFLVGMLARNHEQRNLPATFILSLILSAVLLLIVDLDRPNDGFLRVPHQPMFDLQQQLSDFHQTPAGRS
jgi:hypothetical protein